MTDDVGLGSAAKIDVGRDGVLAAHAHPVDRGKSASECPLLFDVERRLPHVGERESDWRRRRTVVARQVLNNALCVSVAIPARSDDGEDGEDDGDYDNTKRKNIMMMRRRRK
jgi:hypothetical protein